MTRNIEHRDDGTDWLTFTLDQAVTHLQDWIGNIDDAQELARLMREVCGVAKTAISNNGQTISLKIE